MSLADDVTAALGEAGDLIIRKNRDYGSENIARSPISPVAGLAVRLHDKACRLSHLVTSGVPPENESLRDTALDFIGYGTVLLLVLDGKWPGVGAAA